MVKTIAVAGCMRHIGTTTQAIQALLTLKQFEKKACYLEMNHTGYLDNLLALYQRAEERDNKVCYLGVDLYKRTFAKAAMQSGIDYLIMDYGKISTETDEQSFKEQEIKIVVCGSKPNEILKTQELTEKPSYKDAYFIFSFVPEEDQKFVLEKMGKTASKVLFSNIIFDPYDMNQNSIKLYQKILK